MLVLTRKPAEVIRIGEDVVIKVIKTSKGSVKIGVDAPSDVRVMRGELLPPPTVEAASGPSSSPVSGMAARVLSDQFPHVA